MPRRPFTHLLEQTHTRRGRVPLRVRSVVARCDHVYFTVNYRIDAGLVPPEQARSLTPQTYCTRVLPIGIALGLCLTTGNVAYLYNSVAFIQILKAFAPVVLLLVLFAARLEKPSATLIASIMIISGGTAVAARRFARAKIVVGTPGAAWRCPQEPHSQQKSMKKREKVVWNGVAYGVIWGHFFFIA